MAHVQTDLQAMIEFRSRLIRFNRTLDSEYKMMVAGWRSLGEVWTDQKYAELGTALEDVGRGIDRYLAATDEHEAHLRRLIEAIDAFLQVR